MAKELKFSNPTGLAKPLGAYSHICRVKAADLVFIAGQLAVNEAGELVGKGDFERQMRQVFANLGQALASQRLDFSHVVKFTTYLVHSQHIENFMTVRKALFADLYPSGEYPPNTLLIIDRLVGEPFLIEVEAIAAA